MRRADASVPGWLDSLDATLALGLRHGMTTPDEPRPGVPAGLCATCTHARVVESARQSTFFLCGLSFTDPRFPRYPRLPVLACNGYRERPQNA